MKFLRKTFDNLYKKTPEKFHPVVESFDTIFFTPNHVTKSGAHIRDGIDLKRTMVSVIFALIPALLFGMWNIGSQHYLALGETAEFFDAFLFGALRVLPFIVIAYGVGLGVEFIFGIAKGHSLHEGFLVSGMLIPLIVPIDTPLWMVAVATVFGVVIGKEVFGGTGMNILNVALTTRAFLFFAHPTSMSGNNVWISGLKEMKEKGINALSGETPLSELASTLGKAADSETVVRVTEKFTAGGEYSMMHALIGDYAGSIGETSAIAILIGGLYLLVVKIASLRVMLSFFIGGLLMASIFYLVGGDANFYYGVNPIHQLLLGGFMFGMVFMVTDPVTASQTKRGKIIYGFLAGFLAILIRIGNPAYPEGVMLAILIANVSAPLIDHIIINGNIKKREKRQVKVSA